MVICLDTATVTCQLRRWQHALFDIAAINRERVLAAYRAARIFIFVRLWQVLEIAKLMKEYIKTIVTRRG